MKTSGPSFSKFTLALTFFTASVAFASSISWDAILDQNGGAQVYFGVDTDKPVLFDRHRDSAFKPASTSKMFTAAAALELLGGNFQYETLLTFRRPSPTTATEVRLIGNGDPSWGLSEIGEDVGTRVGLIAKTLSSKGIKFIVGDIEIQSGHPAWDETRIPDGWQKEDLTSCDGGVAEAFTLDINCGNYTLNSPTKGAWTLGAITTPVQLNVQPGATTDLTITLANMQNLAEGYVITGTLKNGANVSMNLPVRGTKGWIRSLLRKALEKEGIQFIATTSEDPTRNSPAVSELAPEETLSFLSLPLKEIIKPFLKNSINVIGDALIKTIAIRLTPVLSTDPLTRGLEILNQYVAKSGAGSSIELFDGSGLSYKSHVSPRGLLKFLDEVKLSSQFPSFWNALPIAGVDGTLRGRMRGTAAEGVLRAKTGTLKGTYNLAGYVPYGKDFVPFVMLTNTTPALRTVAIAAEDRFGAQMSSYLQSPKMRLGEQLRSSPAQPDPKPYPYDARHAGRDHQ